MALNRRDSTSVTFAIGRACFRFMIGAVCVVISVTKIIVGSEYVNACPSREMIPVYVIVSGCLPVLLSALRQPYDGGYETDKRQCSMRISLFTAVVGVMVNLAWLIAGTYLVVTTMKEPFCDPQSLGTNGTNELKITMNSTSFSMNASAFSEHHRQENSHLQNTSRIANDFSRSDTDNVEKSAPSQVNNTNIDEEDTKLDTNDKVLRELDSVTPTYMVDSLTDNGESAPDNAKLDNEENKVDETNTKHSSNGSIAYNKGDDDDSSDAVVNNNDGKGDIKTNRKNEKVVTNEHARQDLTGSNEDIVSELVVYGDGSSSKTNSTYQSMICITCDHHIMRFSTAILVIDWVFVIIGIVYFCHFVYSRFGSLKEQLLLINA